jgi:hypothetical protein
MSGSELAVLAELAELAVLAELALLAVLAELAVLPKQSPVTVMALHDGFEGKVVNCPVDWHVYTIDNGEVPAGFKNTSTFAAVPSQLAASDAVPLDLVAQYPSARASAFVPTVVPTAFVPP